MVQGTDRPFNLVFHFLSEFARMGTGDGEDYVSPEILSAYPVADQPIGASVPYMPHARPWNSRQVNAPALGSGRDPSDRLGLGTSIVESIAEKDHPAGEKPLTIHMSRPTASVTEIPGAAAPAKKVGSKADYKPSARKQIRGGAMQRDMAIKVEGASKKQPMYHHT